MAAADVDVATQTITLGGGAQWRDMDSNVLYVRNFYADLWEGVLNKGRSLRFVLNHGAIILGTPGSEYCIIDLPLPVLSAACCSAALHDVAS